MAVALPNLPAALMYSLIVLACASLVVSLLLTPLVRDVFRRLGVVDVPNDRKVHFRSVPRVGGVAILLAYVIALAGYFLLGTKTNFFWSGYELFWEVLPAAGIVFAVGLVDDLFVLSPMQKLAGQAVAAGVAYWNGIHVTGFGGHALADWCSLPVTVIWLLAYTNAVNLIDGVDGLAGGLCLLASITTVIVALVQGDLGLAFVTVPLAGALLGFLWFNFSPATVFLGDSGTLLTGFLLGCFGIVWAQKSDTVLELTAPLMALAIPLLDTGFSIIRRFGERKSIFGADRGHIHHRLLDQGMSQRKVALILYAFCAACAFCSFLMATRSVVGIVIIAFCAVTWIVIQLLGVGRLRLAGRMLLRRGSRRSTEARESARIDEHVIAERPAAELLNER